MFPYVLQDPDRDCDHISEWNASTYIQPQYKVSNALQKWWTVSLTSTFLMVVLITRLKGKHYSNSGEFSPFFLKRALSFYISIYHPGIGKNRWSRMWAFSGAIHHQISSSKPFLQKENLPSWLKRTVYQIPYNLNLHIT